MNFYWVELFVGGQYKGRMLVENCASEEEAMSKVRHTPLCSELRGRGRGKERVKNLVRLQAFRATQREVERVANRAGPLPR